MGVGQSLSALIDYVAFRGPDWCNCTEVYIKRAPRLYEAEGGLDSMRCEGDSDKY